MLFRSVLSKPLGTGIVLAGGSDDDKRVAIAGMRTLNRAASELLQSTPGVHAVTDVTGYGLAGHGWEMAERADAVFEIDHGALPSYAGALDAARRGVRTGGDARNRSAVGRHVAVAPGVDPAYDAIVFDPQTSGGLLAAVDAAHAANLTTAGFVAIGRVTAGRAGLRIV